jgi:hypothetical protein
MKDCNIQIGSLHCGMITEAKWETWALNPLYRL